MKIVTCTDLHIRQKTPQSRTDVNWLEQCLGQLEAVFALAEREGASAVLCSGDVGDAPVWSYTAILGMWRLLNNYRDIPFYTTVGQHDVRGNRIEDWPQYSLGLLATLTSESGDPYRGDGIVKVLESGRHAVLGEKIEVYGFGFNQPETIAFLEGKYPFPMGDKFRIALVHALVGPDDAMGWKGIAAQNLRGCQVASFGDVHCGFDIYEFPSGCVAYSTGSLIRSSLTDIGRVPMCALLDIDDDGAFEVQFFDIPDGDDKVVFFTREEAQAAGDTAEAFKEMVRIAREHSDEPPRQRVQRVGEAGGYTTRQINLVVERLEEE